MNKKCFCQDLGEKNIIWMGFESIEKMKNWVDIAEYWKPFWWINLRKCTKCNTYWLVAQEECIHDNFHIIKINEDVANRIIKEKQWPSYFKKYNILLAEAVKARKVANFYKPLESPSIDYVVKIIIDEEPNIKISEIAKLINLDFENTKIITKRITKKPKD